MSPRSVVNALLLLTQLAALVCLMLAQCLDEKGQNILTVVGVGLFVLALALANVSRVRRFARR
ncbi:hypothetical protein ACF6ZU_24710 [Pseudomonas migulae]|uniref:hypothetical protein n=1 Tax=Pseudomonas migulae TaxID=78543 RepID=UPI00371A90AC